MEASLGIRDPADWAALADQAFGPCRAEGLAAVVALVPTHGRELEALLRDELARLDHRIHRGWQRPDAARFPGQSAFRSVG